MTLKPAFIAFFLILQTSAAQTPRTATPPVHPSGPSIPGPSIPAGVVRPAPVASAGAMGGSYASQGIGRPLGGIAPAAKPAAGSRISGYRYLGPVYYVPNAFDSGFDQAAAQPGPEAAPQSGGSRQYPSWTARNGEDPGSPPPPAQLEPSRPNVPVEDPVSPATYLIQFRDRTIRQVLAFWIEGDTLHYVTPPDAHNQASLSLVDMDMTAKLNEGTEPAPSGPVR